MGLVAVLTLFQNSISARIIDKDTLVSDIVVLEYGLSLHPIDEVDEDGWQFFLYGNELDLTKIADSEELVFEAIALIIPREIASCKVVWLSDFWCILCFYVSMQVYRFVSGPISGWWKFGFVQKRGLPTILFSRHTALSVCL